MVDVIRKAFKRYSSYRTEVQILLLLAFLLLVISPAYNRSRASSPLKLSDLPVLSLEGFQRVLVVAPHPDDESIAAAGLIQESLAEGKEVKIVVMTLGDGQPFAPLAIQRHLGTRASDYVSMGNRRYAEALAAAEHLGVSPEQIDFLGYPDRGLMPLWLQNWKVDCPYRSVWTRSTAVPYAHVYRSNATYCGSDLLGDLAEILSDYRPDLVLIPHPNDDHPDHRATANFVRLALTLLYEQDPGYQPRILGYLVHYGYFPQPRRPGTRSSLLPPVPLSGPGTSWLRFDLDDDQIRNKQLAIRSHASQVRLLGSFLTGFARRNELFLELPMDDLSLVGYNTLPLHETGVENHPIVGTTNESLRRLLVRGADLTGWQVARLGDSLVLTADTRGQLLPGLEYRILVKTPDGETFVYTLKSTQVTQLFSSFAAHIDLAEIGDPPALGFAAEVRQGAVLDSTGWSFLVLKDAVIDGP